MKPIKLLETNSFLGASQKQYQTLPVVKLDNQEGTTVSCWKMNLKERIKVLIFGRVFIAQWTFKDPLQPVLISTNRKEVYSLGSDKFKFLKRNWFWIKERFNKIKIEIDKTSLGYPINYNPADPQEKTRFFIIFFEAAKNETKTPIPGTVNPREYQIIPRAEQKGNIHFEFNKYPSFDYINKRLKAIFKFDIINITNIKELSEQDYIDNQTPAPKAPKDETQK